MNESDQITIEIFNKGASYGTTSTEQELILKESGDTGNIHIQEWREKSYKAYNSAEFFIVLLTTAASGLLGGALSEAGKDLYLKAKQAVVRLFRLKVKETYRSNSRLCFIMFVDDVPVAITINLFDNLNGENAPTITEIEEVFDKQFATLDRNWPMIEVAIRDIRRNKETVSVTILADGQFYVELKWTIPGWHFNANMPGRVEREEIYEILKNWDMHP